MSQLTEAAWIKAVEPCRMKVKKTTDFLPNLLENAQKHGIFRRGAHCEHTWHKIGNFTKVFSALPLLLCLTGILILLLQTSVETIFLLITRQVKNALL